MYFQKIPTFHSKEVRPDFKLPVFERGVAVIQVKNTDKYVVYDRQDNLWRFPGGHVEKNETPKTAAIRETEEEVGLSNLEYIKKITSINNFFLFKNKASRALEHYFLFTTDLENWKSKKTDEKGIFSTLKTKTEIIKNRWKQIEWIFKQI